jgi:hypothetical protein
MCTRELLFQWASAHDKKNQGITNFPLSDMIFNCPYPVLTFNGACLDYLLLHDEWRLIGAWSAVGYQRWVFGEEAVNNNIIVFGLILHSSWSSK